MHPTARHLLSGLTALAMISTVAPSAQATSWAANVQDVMNLVYCVVGVGSCDGLQPIGTVDQSEALDAAFADGVDSVDITSDNPTCDWGGEAWDGAVCVTLSDLCVAPDPPATGTGCAEGESPRRWRLLQNSSGAMNWFVAEVELFETYAGGADLTSPGLAGTQANAARNPERAHLAFDNNDNPMNDWGLWYVPDMEGCYDEAGVLYLCPPEVGTDWLSWDFGPGADDVINRVRIRQHEADWADTWSYVSLMVQSSCDGVTWTDEWVMGDLPTDGTWTERVRP